MVQCVETSDAKLARIAAVVAGILLSILAWPLSGANAQYRGTPEMQQACTPDVMRMCNDDVPDLERITACMKRNRANLSPACGAAMGAGQHRHHSRHR
jgi:Cysteine rich repeat